MVAIHDRRFYARMLAVKTALEFELETALAGSGYESLARPEVTEDSYTRRVDLGTGISIVYRKEYEGWEPEDRERWTIRGRPRPDSVRETVTCYRTHLNGGVISPDPCDFFWRETAPSAGPIVHPLHHRGATAPAVSQ